ncbi:MAG: hypothetical protein ABSH28_00630 [Acidobacteriota bacterium]|jgi:hypothetical protein
MATAAGSSIQTDKTNMQPAVALLKAARNAMRGEAKVGAVKSLIVKGEEKARNEWYGQVSGATQEWIVRSFEMRMLFPDHFVRIWGAILPGGKPARSGFSGKDSVPAREPGKAPTPTWQQSLDAERAHFGRLMLILLLRTDGAAPATVRAAAGSESTLEVSGLGPFPGYLELDKTTHLPSRLRYQMEMRTASGPTGEISNQIMNADDWRDIGGIKLPHHLTIARDGKIYEDYRFQTIQVNPSLTAADFK